MSNSTTTNPILQRAFSFSLIFALFAMINCSFGQSGAWFPEHSLPSYPRILLAKSELTEAKKNIISKGLAELASGVYQSAVAAIPGDNMESSSRRERARIAKNAAFVVLMNYKWVQNQAYTLTPAESDSLKKRVLSLLSTVNTFIPAISITNPSNYDDWQWRTKDMIDYLSAYDLLKGADVPDSLLTTAKATLQQYAGNLYREATRSFFGLTFFSTVKNNHALMTCGALGVAAVVLNDATSTDLNEQPIRWIDAALWNMDNIFWRDAARQSDSTTIAGYAEGPYYLRYAMLNDIPFMQGMWNFMLDTTTAVTFNGETRTITNPRLDKKYHNLWNWIYRIALPDGTLPPIGDTYVLTAFPEIELIWAGKSRLYQNSSRTNTYNNQLNSTVDMRANYLAAYSGLAFELNGVYLNALSKSGDLVFRSSRDSDAVYMHVCGANGLARTSGAGHNQADVSSFIIYRGGEPIARDGGYISYARRGEVGNATNHNMILVDGAGPIIGAPAQPNDADGFIENSVDLPNLHYGEVRTNYLGTDISRSFLFIRKSYFMNADFMSSDKPHSYTWQFHSGGKNEQLSSNSNTGYFRSSEFITGVTSANGNGQTPMTFSTDSAVHESAYNATAKHVVLLAKTSPVTKAALLALLSPIDKTTSRNQRLSSEPNFATATINDTLAHRSDYVLAQEDTSSITWNIQSDTLRTDARFGYWSFPLSGGNLKSAFIREGTQLITGNDMTIKATPRMNVAIDYSNDTLLLVNTSQAGEIILETPFRVTNVTDKNISSWEIIPQTNKVRVKLSAPSTFTVNLTKNALSVYDSQKILRPRIMNLYPNPASSFLTVFCEGINRQSSLHIINMVGIEQFSVEIDSSSSVQNIPLDAIASGVYQLVLMEQGTIISAQKVVVIR